MKTVDGCARTLVDLLNAASLTCSTAESCTGGGIGAAITSVPGASAVFNGGAIVYANSAKRDVLGVPAEILDKCGAVSAECAAAMAEGARRLYRTDLAVSATGIAGPGGGSAEKPVGLVWFAIASSGGVRAEKALFPGGRDEIRAEAVIHAIGMLSAAAISKGGKK